MFECLCNDLFACWSRAGGIEGLETDRVFGVPTQVVERKLFDASASGALEGLVDVLFSGTVEFVAQVIALHRTPPLFRRWGPPLYLHRLGARRLNVYLAWWVTWSFLLCNDADNLARITMSKSVFGNHPEVVRGDGIQVAHHDGQIAGGVAH